MSDNITKEQALEAAELLVNFFAQEDSDEGSEASESVSIPTADEIENLDSDGLAELAEKLSIDVEGKKEKVVRKLFLTLAAIVAEEEVEEDDINSLAEALGLTPAKKVEKTVAAIKEWAEAVSPAGEASTEDSEDEEEKSEEDEEKSDEDDDEEKSEDEEDEEKSDDDEESSEDEDEEKSDDEDEEKSEDEESSDDDSSDGVDREAVAKKFKSFPDVKSMVKNLTAYNEKASEEIEFNPKKESSVKDAYRKLVAELVDSAEEVAPWGTAYIRDGSGWCCGLPLDDVKIKGEKRPTGKCAVTGKVFAFNSDEDEGGEFVELKTKK